MERKQIKALLEKYYGGNTSRAEEEELRKVLSQDSLPPEFIPDRDVVLSFAAAGRAEPPEGFEDRLLAAIRTREQDRVPRIRPFRKAMVLVSGIAASLALLAGTYFLLQNRQAHPDTFSDPQLAYLEARNTLVMVSELMNRGTSALENFSKVEESMQELHHLTRISAATSSLENLSAWEKGLRQLSPIDYIYTTQEKIKSIQ